MDAQRHAFCYQVVEGKRPVRAVCDEVGISPKTAYKWLKRYREDPLADLSDRSRRPLRSPRRSDEAVEASVLKIHDQKNWGGRKIRRLLADAGEAVVSIRTISNILRRHGRTQVKPAPAVPPEPQRFERGAPNELWQLDHLGPREIARRKHHGFTVVDDHSRFCLCFEPLNDVTFDSYWPILWEIFGIYGLPEAILCDGSFAARNLGLSQIDMRLIRLGIRPVHGRPYHPQTQGKVERLHRTIQRELIGFNARTDTLEHFCKDRDRWIRTYNYIRPHESLQDYPPISRFKPSPRKRPATLPDVEYDPTAVLRKVSQVGDIHYRRVRISIARSLAGQSVRIQDCGNQIEIYYAQHQLRSIGVDQLANRGHNELI